MSYNIDDEISFRKLEVLLAFMETGNLAKAADRLGTTSVSVHRALHSLESGMRCSLFRLEGRNLQATDAARMLAEVSRDVLRTMADGIRETRQAAGYSADHIRIGSLYSLTNRTVPVMVMALKLRCAELQPELILGSNADLLQKLRDGKIDAALMGSPDNAADLVAETLFEDEIFFAAPARSRFVDLPAVDLCDCVDEPFVSLSEGFVTYGGFMEAFRIADFTPKIAMKTGDIFSLMNLVDGGVGCTLLPGRVRSVMPGNVRLIPLQEKFRMRQSIALHFLRTRERDPNLLALLAVCRVSKAQLA